MHAVLRWPSFSKDLLAFPIIHGDWGIPGPTQIAVGGIANPLRRYPQNTVSLDALEFATGHLSNGRDLYAGRLRKQPTMTQLEEGHVIGDTTVAATDIKQTRYYEDSYPMRGSIDS